MNTEQPKELTIKEFASLGGLASAKKLTKAQRIARAKKAGLSKKKRPVDNSVDSSNK